MKKSKKNYVIIVLIVLLLALAVGYAAFSASLVINGTVTGDADWDVKFTAATITPSTKTGVVRTATIGGTNNNTITVAAELCYPGDGCEVTATITNEGDLDAKLTAFNLSDETGFDVDDDGTDDIVVTLPNGLLNEKLSAGQSCEVTFTIQWDKDSEVTDLQTATFKINFEYEQYDQPVNVTTNHSSHT